jgi:hypothetical protein
VPVVNKLLRAESSSGGGAPPAPADAAAAAAQSTGGAPGSRPGSDAGGGAAARPGAAAAAWALSKVLPLQVMLLEQAEAAAAELEDADAWAGEGPDYCSFAPHGAAAALATAARGAAALGGAGGRGRGGRALQLHGRRAIRLIRWAHDPRLAGQLRSYSFQHPAQGRAGGGGGPGFPWPQQVVAAAHPPVPAWLDRLRGSSGGGARHEGSGGGGGASAAAAAAMEATAPAAAPPSAAASAASLLARRARRASAGGGPAGALALWARRALDGGLLRDGLRAAALAAPRLVPALARAAGPLLSRLLPAAVGVEILGSALLAAVVPRTCTIGQQWVLTHEGARPAGRPAQEYPQQPHTLGLRELGGFFAGHRMISYRNRIAQLTGGGAAAPGRRRRSSAAGSFGGRGGSSGGRRSGAGAGARGGSAGSAPTGAEEGPLPAGGVLVSI